jgi:hypothetical protein
LLLAGRTEDSDFYQAEHRTAILSNLDTGHYLQQAVHRTVTPCNLDTGQLSLAGWMQDIPLYLEQIQKAGHMIVISSNLETEQIYGV